MRGVGARSGYRVCAGFDSRRSHFRGASTPAVLSPLDGWRLPNRAAATLEPLQEAHMPVYFVLFAAFVAFCAWALCDAAAHADDAMGER